MDSISNGYEFYENRITVIFDYEKSYDEILSILEKTQDDIETKYKDHPFLDLEDINKKIKDGLKSTEIAIKTAKDSHPNWLQKDDVLDEINKLFDGNVGKNYDKENLERIKKEGAERYSKRIPPGYKDNKKEEHKRYGDLILWYQIIDKAKETNKPIIFISGDVKEDWWLEKSGKRLMPLPQLKKEIYEKANVEFHIYTADRFLEVADKFLKLNTTDKNKISPETINEIKKIRELEEKRMMVKRRESLDIDQGLYSNPSKELYTQYLNLYEQIERLGIDLKHSNQKASRIIDEQLRKVKIYRNIIAYEMLDKPFTRTFYRFTKDILSTFERLIQKGNNSKRNFYEDEQPEKLLRTVRSLIDILEELNHRERYL